MTEREARLYEAIRKASATLGVAKDDNFAGRRQKARERILLARGFLLDVLDQEAQNEN